MSLLYRKPMHIYAISKEIGESYPLTYLYVTSLEKAGLVESYTEEGIRDERVRRFYRIIPFRIELTPEFIAWLTEEDRKGVKGETA